MQAALSLFAQNGYEAVSVRDIAAQLSLSKAALYKHYKSKRDIFEQIVARMEREDALRADAHRLPPQPLKISRKAYTGVPLSDVTAFAADQYRYWTQNPFACSFRRLLTLEQYRSAEMSALYQQYICSGPLGYTADLFAQFIRDPDRALDAAAEFYGPMFLFYSMYDGGADPEKLEKTLREHFKRYEDRTFE